MPIQTNEIILGIDCGGSGTVCAAVAADGRLLGIGRGGPANPLSTGMEQAGQAVAEAVQACLNSLDSERVIAVHVGGADEELDPGAEYLSYLRRFPRVTVSSDLYAAWAGAGLLEPGTIVAAGTGSMALTVTAAGEQIRRGGWGHLLGDEGSAYRIGLSALRTALSLWEQGGEEHLFLLRLLGTLGVDGVGQLWNWVYRERVPRAEIAALSRAVDEWAHQGCSQARGLLEQAGQELAELAAKAVLSPISPKVWYTGGVFSSQFVQEAFEGRLSKLVPGVQLSKPQLSAHLGAVLLAYRGVYPEHAVEFGRRLAAKLGREGDYRE